SFLLVLVWVTINNRGRFCIFQFSAHFIGESQKSIKYKLILNLKIIINHAERLLQKKRERSERKREEKGLSG
ncbi:hypothetical protein, partial [Melghiribacillus thermohalophilus]|uniref:hypothetical protein n=1 Tax=Melghiribacillus thermohalophilus TaxID=1324956 RepID=UPI001A9E3113